MSILARANLVLRSIRFRQDATLAEMNDLTISNDRFDALRVQVEYDRLRALNLACVVMILTENPA